MNSNSYSTREICSSVIFREEWRFLSTYLSLPVGEPPFLCRGDFFRDDPAVCGRTGREGLSSPVSISMIIQMYCNNNDDGI
jgi:hypothetical protein